MLGSSPSGLNRDRDFIFGRGTSANIDFRGSASRGTSRQHFVDAYSQPGDDDTVSIDSSGIAQFERVMNRAATVYGRGGSSRPPTVPLATTSSARTVSPPGSRGFSKSLESDHQRVIPAQQAYKPATAERAAVPVAAVVANLQRHPSNASVTTSNFVEDFQDENEWLRRKLRTVTEKFEQQLDDKELCIQKQQHEIRKLQKRIQKECPSVCGIGLADLQHSNERLSAQLARLEVSAVAHENAAKVRECEDAVEQLLRELAAVEDKLRLQTNHWEGEIQKLRQQISTQQADFNVERLECDRVVHAMSVKLEEMGRENAALRVQIHQLVPTKAAAKGHKKDNNNNISSASSSNSSA